MTHLATSATARTLPHVAPPALRAERALRILFLASAHNSVSQRVLVALSEVGHAVTVEVVESTAAIEAAVAARRLGAHRRRGSGRRAVRARGRPRPRDELHTPLAVYRADELARSHECFFGADRSYHEARSRFVHKLGSPCAVTG